MLIKQTLHVFYLSIVLDLLIPLLINVYQLVSLMVHSHIMEIVPAKCVYKYVPTTLILLEIIIRTNVSFHAIIVQHR